MPARVGSGEQTDCGAADSVSQATLCHAKILVIKVYLARQTNGKFWAGNGADRTTVKLAVTGVPQGLGNITAAPYPRVVFQLR
jgi:hypothetical protein